MQKVFLSLGANLHKPFSTLLQAIEQIKKIESTIFVKSSSVYQTSPVSTIKQNDFLNVVCQVYTELSPEKLFSHLQKVEVLLGKKPKSKQEPRMIDIDILFYANQFIQTKKLIIPHPEWKNRLFVLIPLHEICAKIEIPKKGMLDLEPLIKDFPFKGQKVGLFARIDRKD